MRSVKILFLIEKNMKKILFTLLFGLIALISNAQIYNTIKYYDKFDDCIKTENIKTLVNINEIDGIITIETKGKEKEIFWILYKFENGTKNNIENLVDDIYGYEIEYYSINIKDTIEFYFIRDGFYDELDKHQSSKNKNDALDYENSTKIVSKEEFYWRLFLFGFMFNEDIEFVYKIKDRHISWSKYRWDYRDRLFWIRKNDGSRIIYSNE